MRRLILLRHATAAGSLGDDLARPLTAKGTREAAAAGRALATRGLNPDKVLVSPARRTQETWGAMQDFFPGAEVETVPALYEAPPETLLDAAMEQTEADTVLVVAHNPGLHQLAYSLSIRAGRPAPRHFPPGAAAIFGFEGKSPRFPSVILPGEPE